MKMFSLIVFDSSSNRTLWLLMLAILLTACDSQVPDESGAPESAERGAVSSQAGTIEVRAFSMDIMDAFKVTGRGLAITGRIESGTIAADVTLCVPLSGGDAVARPVEGIQVSGKAVDRAESGQIVAVMVSGVERTQLDKDGKLNHGCL